MIWTLCTLCKKPVQKRLSDLKRYPPFCSRSCASRVKPRRNQQGENNHNWRGGRVRHSKGYWYRWTPEGYKLDHRLVAEEKLGRPLRVEEDAHHKDGDRGNNEPENIMVHLHGEHTKLHWELRKAQ